MQLMVIYQVDHKQWLVPAQGSDAVGNKWCRVLKLYSGQSRLENVKIYQCPDGEDQLAPFVAFNDDKVNYVYYRKHGYWSGGGWYSASTTTAYFPKRADDTLNPSKSVGLIDGIWETSYRGFYNLSNADGMSNSDGRHKGGKINVVWMDGHTSQRDAGNANSIFPEPSPLPDDSLTALEAKGYWK